MMVLDRKLRGYYKVITIYPEGDMMSAPNFTSIHSKFVETFHSKSPKYVGFILLETSISVPNFIEILLIVVETQVRGSPKTKIWGT